MVTQMTAEAILVALDKLVAQQEAMLRQGEQVLQLLQQQGSQRSDPRAAHGLATMKR